MFIFFQAIIAGAGAAIGVSAVYMPFAIINEFIKKGKIIQDKSYEHWLENNKPELMAGLLKFVKNNDEFFNALIYEALTGKQTLKKFVGATANSNFRFGKK